MFWLPNEIQKHYEVTMHSGRQVVEENSIGNDRKFFFQGHGNIPALLWKFSLRCLLLQPGKLQYAFLTAINDRHWSTMVFCVLPLLFRETAKYWDSWLLLCNSQTLGLFCVSWTALCLSKMLFWMLLGFSETSGTKQKI